MRITCRECHRRSGSSSPGRAATWRWRRVCPVTAGKPPRSTPRARRTRAHAAGAARRLINANSDALRCLFRPFNGDSASASPARLALLAERHTYTLDWRQDGAIFAVDGAAVLETPYAPRGPPDSSPGSTITTQWSRRRASCASGSCPSSARSPLYWSIRIETCDVGLSV